MAFKVNYNQQRMERDRAKAAKKEAKLREQEAERARRRSGETAGEAAPDGAAAEGEKSDGTA